VRNCLFACRHSQALAIAIDKRTGCGTFLTVLPPGTLTAYLTRRLAR
jgi:hypothetical protein